MSDRLPVDEHLSCRVKRDILMMNVIGAVGIVIDTADEAREPQRHRQTRVPTAHRTSITDHY